ncbi:DUF2809 domain-containing protein [Aggregatimonas sangjinii]|uniref:DUF2809 domain-containing protein n=1 Tax=Aggregatimonas sangjinii TaxID=2583587 RepID=A0A5B7SJK9_9FLAO|nr:DUF2809 domain-containing protein [Aggregatimonas sangjinii]QCW98616.1 DUF2809 domain-containing protein [Aggregatimonas sangjinii]
MAIPKRNRLLYFFLILLTIASGLFSRTDYIPDVVYPYLGDALYAVLIYFLIGFLFPSLRPLKTLLIGIGCCFFIEIFQLYEAEWIVRIRQTRIGGLILGHGFLWSDLLAYLIGAFVAFLLEQKLLKRFFYK